MAGYAVVLLSGSECGEYPGKPCVLAVHGPFETREEARDFAAIWPDWTAPHIMALTPPEESR